MSLKGCVIALSGTFKSETHGSIGEAIEKAGGKYSNATKLADDVTHLVVTEEHWKKGKNTPKVRDVLAAGSKIKVVSIDWIHESAAKKKKVSEAKYQMKTPEEETKTQVKAEEDEKDGPVTGKKRARTTKSKGFSVKKEQNEDAAEGADETDQEPPAKKPKAQDDGQYWRAGLTIPVDEMVPSGFEVYVDDDELVWDASLNQTNAGNNNNKFYKIQVLAKNNKSGNFWTWTRWGRVGETGQSAWLGTGDLDDSKKQFEKKFKDKTGLKWKDRLAPPKKNKYTFIEKNYEEDSPTSKKKAGKGSTKDTSKEPESTLTLPVQQLMTLIFNTENFANAMAAMNYDANKMPLGKLSKSTLKRGFEVLKNLAEVITNPSLAEQLHELSFRQAVEQFSNSYYTLIPHSFGRDRPPIIQDQERLKKEIELLESLSDMEISDKIMKEAKADVTDVIHPLDRQYQGLGMAEMTDLDPNSNEYTQLRDYLVQSTGQTHDVAYKVEAIFRIERQGEFDRFSKSPFANVKSGDRRLLWHGSRATNFGGILSQGLRIAPPEAPVSGYMFGKGIYLADISSKSAGYTASYLSGGVGLLLLCEAELGKPMLELMDANYSAEVMAKEQNSISTWGKGSTAPRSWKDAGCVHENLKGVTMPDMSKPPGSTGVNGALYYNEYICYDVAQIRLRYLFRVKMH